MTENNKINELTFGEYETEAGTYSMKSTTTDNGGNSGSYEEPENTTPNYDEL